MYIATIKFSSTGATEQEALDNLAFDMDEISRITGAGGSAHLADYAKVYQRPDKVRDVEHLKWLASRDEGLDCFILLQGGLKSSKHITYADDTRLFYVLNLIDGSYDVVNEKQIVNPDYTNLGTAMANGNLIIE